MTRRVTAAELPVAPDVPGTAEYVALVRLERPGGGFVEPGERAQLTQASAAVLLAAGLVEKVMDEDAPSTAAGGQLSAPTGAGDAEE